MQITQISSKTFYFNKYILEVAIMFELCDCVLSYTDRNNKKTIKIQDTRSLIPHPYYTIK